MQMRTGMLRKRSHIKTHTHRLSLTHRQTHTIETEVVLFFFFLQVTVTNFKASGKVPPSSPPKRIVQMFGFSLSLVFLKERMKVPSAQDR